MKYLFRLPFEVLAFSSGFLFAWWTDFIICLNTALHCSSSSKVISVFELYQSDLTGNDLVNEVIEAFFSVGFFRLLHAASMESAIMRIVSSLERGLKFGYRKKNHSRPPQPPDVPSGNCGRRTRTGSTVVRFDEIDQYAGRRAFWPFSPLRKRADDHLGASSSEEVACGSFRSGFR